MLLVSEHLFLVHSFNHSIIKYYSHQSVHTYIYYSRISPIIRFNYLSNTFIHSFIYSFNNPVPLILHQSVDRAVYPSIHFNIHSSIHPFTVQPSTHSFHLFIHPFIHLFIRLFIHLFIHLFILFHPFMYLFTHSIHFFITFFFLSYIHSFMKCNKHYHNIYILPLTSSVSSHIGKKGHSDVTWRDVGPTLNQQ